MRGSGRLDEAGDPRPWFRVMPAPEICFLTANELVRLMRAKEFSALEVMEAHLAQIERVNPEVNAIVTLTPEQAIDGARAADDALARGEEAGPLIGLPVAHKDLVATEGVRTTFGSLILLTGSCGTTSGQVLPEPRILQAPPAALSCSPAPPLRSQEGA